MTARTIKCAGEALLINSLFDHLAIAKAVKSKDYISLAGAAQIAALPPNHGDAMIDPARFRAIHTALIKYFTKGYGIMDPINLRALAFNQLREKHQTPKA